MIFNITFFQAIVHKKAWICRPVTRQTRARWDPTDCHGLRQAIARWQPLFTDSGLLPMLSFLSQVMIVDDNLRMGDVY